jgi:hypothetical protein
MVACLPVRGACVQLLLCCDTQRVVVVRRGGSSRRTTPVSCCASVSRFRPALVVAPTSRFLVKKGTIESLNYLFAVQRSYQPKRPGQSVQNENLPCAGKGLTPRQRHHPCASCVCRFLSLLSCTKPTRSQPLYRLGFEGNYYRWRKTVHQRRARGKTRDKNRALNTAPSGEDVGR